MNNANVVKSANPRMRRHGQLLPVKRLTYKELICNYYDLESCSEPVTLISTIISLQQKITASEKRYQELNKLTSKVDDEQDVSEPAMSKNQKNEKVIRHFFAMHGAETGQRLSAFLFEMLALYTASPENYAQWHREETAMHFGMLYKLVNGLREVG